MNIDMEKLNESRQNGELIISAFKYYSQLAPLDLADMDDEDILKKWAKNNQYSFLDFSILASKLIDSENIDDFIENSSADLDNLAIVIKACVRKEIARIMENGEIISNIRKSETEKEFCGDLIKPSAEYNQFPCNEQSVLNRINLFLERYPFTPPQTKIALIGDDDQVSINLDRLDLYDIDVYECDSQVIGIIDKFRSNRVNIFTVDLRNESPKSNECDTFMTDPPYTLHGTLLFIARGLETLNLDGKEKEFYVILNKTMIGKNWEKILRILSEAGIYLHEVRKNFSQYRLPDNFDEKRRAEDFCEILEGYKIKVPEYSSSSDLFVFRTTDPNIEQLKEKINPDLIYEHYL